MRVIIPSGNAKNLIRCLDAMYASERGLDPTQVIVIADNDEVSDVARSRANVIRGSKPFAWVKNINIGLCAASSGAALLLDDNTFIRTPGAIGLLAETAAKNNVACVGPRIVGVGPRWQVIPGTEPVPWIIGAAFFMAAKAFRLFDERFTGYGFQESDWCRTARQAGLTCAVDDRVLVDHEPSTIYPATREFNDPALMLNRAVYLRKWGDTEMSK